VKKRLSAKDGNKLYKTGSIVPAERDKHEPKHKAEGTAVGTASKCLEEIRRYDKQFEGWERRSKEIIDRYRDERDNVTSAQRCFNILWANTQILKPTLYARQPKTEVTRRFKDQDTIARIGAEIAERGSDTEIERAGLHDVLEQCTLDLLLPGRAVAWVSYDPKFQGEDEQRVKTDDGIVIDYVDYRDFGHNTAPVWQKVTKVWRWKYFDRQAVKKRFKNHAEWIDKLEFNEKRTQDKGEPETQPEARIAEVWDKVARKVYWVSKAVPDYLDEYDDPLHLQGFFPCPRPLYATTTNNSLVPVPHFYLYQDQANEVDKLTGRINRLTDALKIVGAYDQSFKALEDMMSPSGVADNTLVPVDMNDLTGKGGLAQVVQLVDISQVIETIQACYLSRQQAIQAIYEITGISDVIRGATDPEETARAQEIKSQFGGTRIKDMQQDVAGFARDIIRICTEIVVEMYDPQKLWDMTNAESFVGQDEQGQPNVEVFARAVRLLRDDKLRSYRVDIETDSTIAMDEADAKQEAVEFMKVIGETLAGGLEIVSNIPQATEFFGEALLFVARRFKGGRTLESSIEKMVQQLQQAAQEPKQDPEMIKVQGEMAIMQEKMKLMQMQAQIKAAEGQQKLQLERELAQLEIQIKAMELQMEQRKTEMEISADAAKHRQEMMQMQQKGAIETRLAQQQGQQQLRMGEQKAQQQKQIGDQKVQQAKSLAKAKPANARPA
jgi:hypothetical protein